MTASKSLALGLALSAASFAANAQSAPKDSDYYIRAEHSDGAFIASHQILAEPGEDFFQVRYCDTPFWVRASTVRWTEDEAEAGNKLFLIRNTPGEQRIICAEPEKQVTLKDLGINREEFIARESGGFQHNKVKPSRLSVIAEAFKSFKN
ncbi:MAG: hypothetical protein HWE23_12615 [Rhodobacteraceae bacterium]|nr:hypothetical protein [Paracoccaceae bacterium]